MAEELPMTAFNELFKLIRNVVWFIALLYFIASVLAKSEGTQPTTTPTQWNKVEIEQYEEESYLDKLADLDKAGGYNNE